VATSHHLGQRLPSQSPARGVAVFHVHSDH